MDGERITYARERLLRLLGRNGLRAWCREHGVPHGTVYKIALGESSPLYSTVCSMVDAIPAVEWLFFTGEELPYRPRLQPKWDPSLPSAFVRAHRHDYRQVAGRYGLPELSAYNIFVAYRAKPTLALIRACCAETDPCNFFAGEFLREPGHPARGDICRTGDGTVLVLSRAETAESGVVLGCPLSVTAAPGSVPVPGTGLYADPLALRSYDLRETGTVPSGSVGDADFLSALLAEVRKALD